MRTKLAVLGVVGLVAAALIYWFGFRDAPRPTTTAAATTEDTWGTPAKKAEPPAEPAARPKGMPRMAFETDPDGPLALEGQVLDEQDQPVAGARVRISTSPPRTVETDTDGSFTIDKLLGRSYRLTARAGDKIGGPATVKVVANPDPVVIRLRPGVALTVNVSDAATKKPIAGATVTLVDGSEITETTGADGKAVFRGLDDGWTTVMASAPRYGAATGTKTISVGDKAATLELALRTGAALSGTVVDESGTGIGGARVWPVDVSSAWEQAGADLAAVTSAADGTFTIAALPAGSYLLRGKTEQHAPASTAPITVTGETATTGIRIVMKAAASVSGVIVTVEGRPVPYATVTLSSRELTNDMVQRKAAADEQGRFELRALPRTAVKLRAESDDAASRAIDVDLAATPITKDLKLVLDQTDTIAGIVVDGAGEPIAEAQVRASPDFAGGDKNAEDFVLAQGASASTDGDGRFTLRGLETGKFRITASRTVGGQTARGGRAGQVASTGEKNLKIVLPAPGGVKGKVERDDGEPPAMALVSADWEHRVTIRDGAFELTDLVPGKYDLRVTGSDFAEKVVRDVTIAPGKITDTGTIVVRPGRTISGRVVDASGQGVEGARVLFGRILIGDGKQTGRADEADAAQFGIRQTATDASGGFVISGVSRTSASIVGEHPDRGRSLGQKVPAGGEDVKGLTLTLKGYGSIAGTVTRAGVPVAGASISVASQGSSGQATFVVAGDDGAFVIDKVAAGPTSLTAMKNGMMSAEGSSRMVTVVAGQRVDGSIAIPVGAVALTIKIVPREGATVNAAQLFLFRAAGVTLTKADDVFDAFYGATGVRATLKDEVDLTPGGAAGMKIWTGGDAHPLFKDLPEGVYSACIIPITGDIMGDPQLLGRVLESLDQLEVICQNVTVTPAPLAQTTPITVPSMRTLVPTE